jgi:pimeloyl-ACP methyl ester carboxylesterase
MLNPFAKFLSVLMMIVVLSGCSRHPVATPHHARQVESAIIVVPGYYGTRLVRETDSSLVFISLTQVLFGDQTLTLPLPGFGFEGTINLQPDGILDEVRVVPLFYSIDVYGSLLARLRFSNNTSRDVIPFAYDWRGDLMEAVRSLDALIRRLRVEGKKDISVVAHSMGGLIVSYYLRYGTQDIDAAVETWKGAEELKSVVLAGVPFLGVMNSFRNMNFGVTVGLNSSLLSSEAYASFPASYYTLPVADSDELLTPELKPLRGMIRNAEHWQQAKWGLLKIRKTFSNEIVERRSAYTSFWLYRSQRFLELIRAPLNSQSPHHPSLLYVYARGTPTLAKGVWVRSQAKGTDSLLFDDSDLAESRPAGELATVYGDGDGTVTVPSVALPLAYRQTFLTTIREYEVGHTELVSGPDIQHEIVTFLDNQ